MMTPASELRKRTPGAVCFSEGTDEAQELVW